MKFSLLDNPEDHARWSEPSRPRGHTPLDGRKSLVIATGTDNSYTPSGVVGNPDCLFKRVVSHGEEINAAEDAGDPQACHYREHRHCGLCQKESRRHGEEDVPVNTPHTPLGMIDVGKRPGLDG